MDDFYSSELFVKNFSSGSNYFKVSYTDSRGLILHGLVKQVSPDHFEVLVQEKEVIIRCIKDKNGVLSCKLNSSGNPEWIDGISNEVAKMVSS
ncbi:hypothetical protein WG906_18950 [Pedobacter sp. P351]|uniref:hypothetical protein n=1 Tax=Pedobacter superstes TaxID=3133441 RepID=UPI0030A3BD4D